MKADTPELLGSVSYILVIKNVAFFLSSLLFLFGKEEGK